MRHALVRCVLFALAAHAAGFADPLPVRAELRFLPAKNVHGGLAVEVTGFSLGPDQIDATKQWNREEWEKLLTVTVDRTGFTWSDVMPPMAGSYAVDGTVLRFVSPFPAQGGTRYRARFDPAAWPGGEGEPIHAVHAFPAVERKADTTVAQVYPSADELPENLLKFYIHFSAPMSRGDSYRHIQLLDEEGQVVDLPFLELGEELWNREMTRLTLFIDPGRIKRGVKPREDVGPALQADRRYTLTIDASWLDAGGAPLKEAYRKQFSAIAPERRAIDPAQWQIEAPSAGTRLPLRVRFTRPLDHAVTLRVLRVVDVEGREIVGEARLEDGERQWVFTPVQAWPDGGLELVGESTMEDLAGNNIGQSFEMSAGEGKRIRSIPVRIPLPSKGER